MNETSTGPIGCQGSWPRRGPPPTWRRLNSISVTIYRNPRCGKSRQTLLEAVAEHPKVIERPPVVSGDEAALGRPPEQVLDIL